MALPKGPVLSKRTPLDTYRAARRRFEGLTTSSRPNDRYRVLRKSQHGAVRRLMNIITRLRDSGTVGKKGGKPLGWK